MSWSACARQTHTHIHSYITPTQCQWPLQVDIVGAILSTRLETSISAVVVGVAVVAVSAIVTAAFVVYFAAH